MENIDFQFLIQKILELVSTYGLRLFLALFSLIIGWKIINFLTKMLHKWFKKTEFDEALETFLQSVISLGLKVILIITSAGIAGFPTTSLVAILGAAGLAVGMALSGTLQNFAGGVLLLILKPFRVGDTIETEGYTGKVQAIQIFNTIINTADNKRIILPNGPVSTKALVNYSVEKTRRVDMVFGISYEDEIDKAKTVLRKIIDAESRILPDPRPLIALSELADSSVNFSVRVWTKTEDYWSVYYDMLEEVKKTFDKESISIPYPHTQVYLQQK